VLRNDSSTPLEDVHLIEDGRLRALGTVPSDAERSFAAPARPSQATEEPQQPGTRDGAAGPQQGRGLPPVRRAVLEQLVKLVESDAGRIDAFGHVAGAAGSDGNGGGSGVDGPDGTQASAREYLVFWLPRPLLRTEVDHSPSLSREITVVTMKLPAGWRHAE
jgi:hypothetical protein